VRGVGSSNLPVPTNFTRRIFYLLFGNAMVNCKFIQKSLLCALITVFYINSPAQSLGDLSREQKQKKASAQGHDEDKKVFSNLDSPQPDGNQQPDSELRQQEETLLHIASPADGAIASPGETIQVRVTPKQERLWQAILVVTEINDAGLTQIARALPADFSVTIPSNIDACRKYMLTVMGKTSAGEEAESMIDVDIERPDMPMSISSFQFDRLTLQANPKDPLDRPFSLIILATFADGKNFEVTESSYVTYESSNTAVATVDKNGGVRARAPGVAFVTVQYKNPNGERVHVSVPVTVSSQP
jgi:Big-like domain-containing protein